MGSVESGSSHHSYETVVGTQIPSLGSVLKETTTEKDARGCCCNRR
jgi:hypothetical protein